MVDKNNLTIKIVDKSQLIDDFFGKNIIKKFVLDSFADFKYFFVASHSNIDLEFCLSGDGVIVNIYGIIFSKNKDELDGNISVFLKNNNCKANVYLVSFLADGAVVKVRGSIDIQKGLKSVSGYLLEENVVLGEKVKINTLPILNVSSNDVSAGHGARIHKLDREKLFYMMSKGISESNAKKIVIKGYVDYILGNFDLLDEEKIKLQNQILNYLL